jgi:integration host factor subunit alpha
MCWQRWSSGSAFGCAVEAAVGMNTPDPHDGIDPGEDDDPATSLVALPTLETPTLTKAELAELLFERLGLNKRESKDMVEAFFDLVHATLVSGHEVKMSGFGNFNIRRKAPRPGRNPRTGESIPIKARNVVTFHASHKLKGVVQGDIPPEEEFE